MVDAIVSYAVGKLDQLGGFLIREAAFLHGVKNEVVELQNELSWMRSFLKDAEQKQDGNERIRVWVSEIQDIAYDTQDVIETFIFKVNGQPIQTSKRGKLSSSVKSFFGISTKVDLYGIGKEIEALKNRVLEVSRKRESYGITNIGGGIHEGTSSGDRVRRNRRLTTPYEDEEHVVGFENDAQLLEEQLFLNEPQRSVISILGMGGLGKTTLARKLYNNNNNKFGRHAWVCVSQEWEPRDLLSRLIKSFKTPISKDYLEKLEKMTYYDMEPELRELLEGRRYLVVIDDVWQINAWESLKRALPDNKNRSRIIITTRIEAVAEHSGHRTYVHKLRFLQPDESWQLFCTRAFLETNGVCPRDRVELGKQMTAKCGGLPLAIIVLGGLLSRKQQFHEWQVVKERIWRELKNDSSYISLLLDLSYKDLPHELKSCFLYVGLFPEDYIIDVNKLIQLWVAEEFITQEDGLDLEEVAEDYLKELIGRSLIQVVERNWRMTTRCRVHDLLRDLAVNKAKELKFLHISDESIKSAPSSTGGAWSSYRRIAFGSRLESCKSLDHSQHQRRVRTLSFLNNFHLKDDDAEKLMLVKLLYPSFGSVRVLELHGVEIKGQVKLRFDEVVGKLIHLRYLGLYKTDITELPESIGNLQALQTLNVAGGYRTIIKLPTNIHKLKQLRHLIGYFEMKKNSRLARRQFFLFDELTNLQRLKSFYMAGWRDDEFAFNAFAKLENLKMLSVVIGPGNESLFSVQPLHNCRHLIDLGIQGKIRNLPEDMHTFLPNLKSLTLTCSRFTQDPIPALEKFPNLLFLVLHTVGVGLVKNMTCTATGFPQLEVLRLDGLDRETKFQVDEAAMPKLRALVLNECKSLRPFFPQRLRSLPDTDAWGWGF